MKSNQITYKVTGRYALFTDPLSKIGGEKSTLPIPTAEALRGITSSIYWKPSIVWHIDELKVLNPIRMEYKGIRPLKYDGGNDIACYTYLTDVSYLVRTHFTFCKKRPELKEDWNEDKHFFIAKRSLAKGGRRDVFLGVRECQAYVEEGDWEEQGCYAGPEWDMDFGLMFHSFLYPDQTGKNELEALFWHPKMRNGVIRFCRQEECTKRIPVKRLEKKTFGEGNFSGLKEPQILDGYREGGEAR